MQAACIHAPSILFVAAGLIVSQCTEWKKGVRGYDALPSTLLVVHSGLFQDAGDLRKLRQQRNNIHLCTSDTNNARKDPVR